MGAAWMSSVMFAIFLAVTWSFCYGLSLPLSADMLEKRVADGNPCPDAEKPFPCKSTPTCIPMGYLCDDNTDCEDGYDEDPEVCTAAHRPPVVDIMNFLESTKGWMMNKLFAGKDIREVAHALAVSPTVADFRSRLKMSDAEVENLKIALDAVAAGDEDALESLDMPPSAWNKISVMFAKLIKSGFAA